MYRVKGKLQRGMLMNRENRFVCYVKYNNRVLRCHLPNPGRMTELMDFGESEVLIRLAQEGSKRKTDATIIAIMKNNVAINLDTQLFSELIPHEIELNPPDVLKGWEIVDKEVTLDNHRYDFLFTDGKHQFLTEVKSTTRVIDGIACFPDAVSKRATDHVRGLMRYSGQGRKAMILFTIYREADFFGPCEQIDPEFSKVFWEAVSGGIKILPILISSIIEHRDDGVELYLKMKDKIPLVDKRN